MGFFRSLKEKVSKENEQKMGHNRFSDTLNNSQQDQLSHPHLSTTNYDNPTDSNTYEPPSGPLPTHIKPKSEAETNEESNPPPYESWLSVPDTSQLPPPPNISNEYSPSNNASYHQAELGHQWCARNPVYTPSIPHIPEILNASQRGELGMDPPPLGFRGSVRQMSPRKWEVKTDRRQQDMILTSTLPIYFAAVSNPLLDPQNSRTRAFAFSATITTLSADSVLAVGLTSKPYPPFRLPGWHRGSLAIHSDDGRRYMNDSYGGIDFTRPFRRGDTIRFCMEIHPRPSPVQTYNGQDSGVRRVGGGLPKCVACVRVEVNGASVGGWDVHGERDGERDEGVEGLQGEADLYCAIGVFGLTGCVVEFEGDVR